MSHCVSAAARSKSSSSLGPDMANCSLFNFDKYRLFNLGPAVIQNYQEATRAKFMNPNISLVLKSCCSYFWQRDRNEVII